MDSSVPGSTCLPVAIFRTSAASMDPTVDTTAPMDAGAPFLSGRSPVMHLRHGPAPGMQVATSPTNPSMPPWTRGFPLSTEYLFRSILPPTESRQSTRTSHSDRRSSVSFEKRTACAVT